MFMGPCIATIF